MALVDSPAATSPDDNDGRIIHRDEAGGGCNESATPNTGKLAAALDDIAGFAADARDTAGAKLNAAVTKTLRVRTRDREHERKERTRMIKK